MKLWTFLGIAILILLWELAALFTGSDLLVPSLQAVFRQLIVLIQTPAFFNTIAGSFSNVFLGMLVSVPLGLAAGLAAGLDRRARSLLQPLFTLVSSVPVMALILIAFLWFGAQRTPVFTSFLIVFPVMAANIIEGVAAIDPRLRELFTLYRIPFKDRLRSLYLPSVFPFVLGGIRSSLSLCWKVVVAAEVLVQPLFSIGTSMQRAKANLETPELFAWTITTVAAAGLCQLLFSALLLLCRRQRKRHKASK